MAVYNKTVNVGTWKINNSYDIGVEVEYNDKHYVSRKNVPVGINIGDDNYWDEINTDEDVTDLRNDVATIKSELNATVGTSKVPFRFVYDSTSEKYGYLDGADTFHPF